MGPPSVVRTIEVHTGLLQGASPSSQYCSADMAVNETGSKPAGTAPPADWARWRLRAAVGAVVEWSPEPSWSQEPPWWHAQDRPEAAVVVPLLTSGRSWPAASATGHQEAADSDADDKPTKRSCSSQILLTLGQRDGFLGHSPPQRRTHAPVTPVDDGVAPAPVSEPAHKQ